MKLRACGQLSLINDRLETESDTEKEIRPMLRQRFFLALGLACLTISVLVLMPWFNVQASRELATNTIASRPTAKPTPTPDTPVTATIRDFLDIVDSTGATQRYWMQIRSDGAGSYTNSTNLISIIQGFSGDWILDSETPSSPTRTIFLDFTKPVPGSGPNGGDPLAPFSSALVYARLDSRCDLYNYNMLSIPVGATVTCPLAVFFASGGNEYFLQMNPGPNGGDVALETDFLNITCNSVNVSLQCSDWKVTPNGTHGGCLTGDCSLKQNVARLNLRVPVKGKSASYTAVNQGDFYVALSIGITNP